MMTGPCMGLPLRAMTKSAIPALGARTKWPIVAWGDSLTAGTGATGPGTRYPAVAAGLFGPPRQVINKGMGGQTSRQIAARQGGVPILLTLEGDTIPPAYLWSFDWSSGLEGWFARTQGGEQDVALSVADGALVIAANPGPQNAGAAQVSLGLPEGLPVGYTWTLQFDFSGSIGFLNVGLMQDNGVWNGNGTPDLARQGVTKGPARSASTTLAYPGANMLSLFSGNQSGTAMISDLVLSATTGVAVTARSVDALGEGAGHGGSLPGTLAGVHGVLTADGEGQWAFTRDTFGPAVTCPPDTPFISDAATLLRGHTAWIWAGRNDNAEPEQVKASIAAMIGHLGHTRYLVGGVLNAGAEIAGSAAHGRIVALNADLAALYGPRFVDLRAMAIAAGDPVADSADIANDVIPASLRSDGVHLNDAGYSLVAQAFHAATIARGW